MSTSAVPASKEPDYIVPSKPTSSDRSSSDSVDRIGKSWDKFAANTSKQEHGRGKSTLIDMNAVVQKVQEKRSIEDANESEDMSEIQTKTDRACERIFVACGVCIAAVTLGVIGTVSYFVAISNHPG